MIARDLMTSLVLFVYPEDPARHAVEVMAEQQVSGLPVVNPVRQLVGIVTERDLLLLEELGPPESKGWEGSGSGAAGELLVKDVMTKEVIAFGPEDELVKIAQTIYEQGINRVPIVDDSRKVIGLVSRADIIHKLAQGKSLRE